MANTEDTSLKPSRGIRELIGTIVPYINLIGGVSTVLGGTVFLLSFVFLVSGIVTGGIDWAALLKVGDAQGAFVDVAFVSRVLVFSAFLLFLGLVLWRTRDQCVGFALVLGGLFLRWIVPLGLNYKGLGSNAFNVVEHFKTAGLLAFAAWVPFLFFALIRSIDRVESKPRNAENPDEPAAFKLGIGYFCREIFATLAHDVLPQGRSVLLGFRRMVASLGALGAAMRFIRRHTEDIAALCLYIGLPIFAIAASYLIWVLLNDRAAWAMSQVQDIRDGALYSFGCVSRLLMVSGIAGILGASIRFRNDDRTGYSLLAMGILMYWGVPMAVYYNVNIMASTGVEVMGGILAHFRTLGILCVISAVPLVFLSFWYKVSATRRRGSKLPPHIPTDASDVPGKSGAGYNCWQMQYCRLSLRRHCQAYSRRVTCWRIKSGCQCDDDALLRAMNRKTSIPNAVPQVLPHASVRRDREPVIALDARKRAKCRKCFIYQAHQVQKYRIASTLLFPVVLLVEWVCYTPLKSALESMLGGVTRLADSMAITVLANNNVHLATVGSNSAGVVLMLCVGLIIITVLLRFLEYLIFNLQL